VSQVADQDNAARAQPSLRLPMFSGKLDNVLYAPFVTISGHFGSAKETLLSKCHIAGAGRSCCCCRLGRF
jgi:hypothetical protein